MKKVLLTGFEPFANAKLNPTAEIARQISGDNIVTAILPVSYSSAEAVLFELIEKHNPDVIICLGQAEGRKEITPERIAINLDDARVADNDGVTRTNLVIDENGADGYFSTLPVSEITKQINERGIPSSISLSAGAFLCNHIFYKVQQRFVGTSIKSGFIHVPIMDEQAVDFPGVPSMSLSKMIEAIEVSIEVIQAE